MWDFIYESILLPVIEPLSCRTLCKLNKSIRVGCQDVIQLGVQILGITRVVPLKWRLLNLLLPLVTFLAF